MNTNAVIQYYLSEDCHVTLEIYNSTGQKIMQPLNDIQLKGNHDLQWNTGGLPAGIYYYSLGDGKQTQTGKIIIMK